ncbi:MAG: secretin N-terminal domain-containing protein [Thermodesulfobacteriota bacterium]
MKKVQGSRFKVQGSKFKNLLFVICHLLLVICLLVASPLFALEKSKTSQTVAINFKEIELPVFIKFVSDVIGKSFIFDERIKGKVTIYSPREIDTDELYDVFLSILDFKGYTVLPDGNVIRIIPSQEAKQSRVDVLTEGGIGRDNEGFITRIIPLKFIDVSEIQRIVSPLISRNGAISFSTQTNVLIITDSPYNIDKLVTLIKELDKETLLDESMVHVYYLENANAGKLAKVLNELLGKIRPPRAQKQVRKGKPRALRQLGERQITGPVSITADETVNALIINALPGDFEALKKVIKQLDVRRRQVFVEAAIMEISLSKLRELGFEFRLMDDFNADSVRGLGGTDFGGIGAASAGPQGLNAISGLAVGVVKGTIDFNGTTFLNIGALLRALESETGVNILSTPQLLTIDNQQAEIVVGENVPVIKSQSVTTGGNIQTSIERKDVGITLRLTPHITAGDFVRLDIYQEISSLAESVAFDPNVVGPIFNKRYAETSVVVKDSETIVIAGLIKDNQTERVRKVPILGDIPILGLLFRHKKMQLEKTNLLVFLTPNIIKNTDSLDDIKRRKDEEMEEMREEMREEMLKKKGKDSGS